MEKTRIALHFMCEFLVFDHLISENPKLSAKIPFEGKERGFQLI